MDRSSEYIDEDVIYTVKELCTACRIEKSYVVELVSHGIIEPRDDNRNVWRFDAVEAARTRRAYRLHRDLDLNLEGVALALELMDRNRKLNERVRFLEQLIQRLEQQ
ncbi:MAG: chaperone modulator CbpM [Pseudomonadales bacterium]